MNLIYFTYMDLSLHTEPPPFPASEPITDIKLPPENSEFLGLLNSNVVRTYKTRERNRERRD